MTTKLLTAAMLAAAMFAASAPHAKASPPTDRLTPRDLFDLEVARDPQISPDGTKIAFVRVSADIMTDRYRSGLWIVEQTGGEPRPLGDSKARESAPRWSPDGKKLLFTSDRDGSPQLYLRWMDTGQIAQLTHVQEAPQNAAWSPDGRWIAFSMSVPDEVEPFVKMPAKPKGAEWAKEPKTIRRMIFRRDGEGYLEEAHAQIFILPMQGGTPRPLTRGPYDHGDKLEWTPDSAALLFSANLKDDPDYEPMESEIHALNIADGAITTLTHRVGPDAQPAISPDGKHIAYVGFDDRVQGYQVTQLYVMNRDGSGARALTSKLDRDASDPVFSRDGKGIYFSYDDRATRASHS